MANALYPKGKEKILSAAINLSADTIKAVLLSSAYVYSAAHEFYSDVSANVLDTPNALTTKSVTSGAFDADDTVFGAVAGGSTAKAVAIYKDTGVDATSPLIGYIDVITGFPLATNGGDITVQWDNGANKIFSI